MAIQNLVAVVLLFTLVEFGITKNEESLVNGEKDLSMLSCTEKRNITILVTFVVEDSVRRIHAIGPISVSFVIKKYDTILASLNQFIMNEYCFIVNVYLNSEDRVVRVRKSDDLSNIIERNRRSFETSRIVKLLNRLYEEEIISDAAIKQTFVIIGYQKHMRKILASLRKLQEKRKWAIIILSYYEINERVEWLPLHRYIQMYIPNGAIDDELIDEDFIDLTIKELIDVIRNPNFDRYNMAYRWAMEKDDIFNPSCLKQIKKMHIMMNIWHAVYLPVTLAILRKENTRREQEKREPLEIFFLLSSRFAFECSTSTRWEICKIWGRMDRPSSSRR